MANRWSNVIAAIEDRDPPKRLEVGVWRQRTDGTFEMYYGIDPETGQELWLQYYNNTTYIPFTPSKMLVDITINSDNSTPMNCGFNYVPGSGVVNIEPNGYGYTLTDVK